MKRIYFPMMLHNSPLIFNEEIEVSLHKMFDESNRKVNKEAKYRKDPRSVMLDV